MRLNAYERAIREAGKRLKIAPAKKLNEALEWAADDKAEAYRIGAEEAQGAIIRRLLDLAAKDKGEGRRAA